MQLKLQAINHYNTLKNNMKLYTEYNINEHKDLENNLRKLNTLDNRSQPYLYVKEIEYIPFFLQKADEKSNIPEIKFDIPDVKENLQFASYDLRKMNDDEIRILSEFIYKKIYDHTACVFIHTYIRSYLRGRDYNINVYKQFTQVFLIYRLRTFEIISICFVKHNPVKDNEIEIKYFCSYVDINREISSVRGINRLYPYKGLGNQFMDEVLAVLKGNRGENNTHVKLLSSARGENFYINKGFKVPFYFYDHYFRKTYQKYLKYKEKYLKLKKMIKTTI